MFNLGENVLAIIMPVCKFVNTRIKQGTNQALLQLDEGNGRAGRNPQERT
jgi:hypothetical protein